MLSHHFGTARDQGDNSDKWGSHHAVDNGGHDERLDRVEPYEIQGKPDDGAESDHSIEAVSPLQLEIEALRPPSHFAHGVSRRGGKHWHGQQAEGDDAECEEY